MAEAPAAASVRPYRSHKVRACDHCRKRKSRCTLDIPGKACVMCRVAGIECYYNSSKPVHVPTKRLRTQAAELSSTPRQEALLGLIPDHRSHEAEAQWETLVDGDTELTHIVGPIMADDATVVEQHFSPGLTAAQGMSHYKVCSNDSREPMLYTKVSRRRPGFLSSSVPGAQQRIIMEQILGSHAEEVVNIYFDKIHPSFPILDRTYLGDILKNETILCEIYAISILYWKSSNISLSHPQPDTKYFWNLAVSALQEEFLSPGLSTVHSALIDLTGRPSLWLTGNVINSGRTVALAHSLGLNRNPRNWKIHKSEQDNRIRLWWGILIHDRWASFAHGVPPNIMRVNYDVPLPSMDSLKYFCGKSTVHLQSAEIFISLCSLSQILGHILPLVYDISIDKQKHMTEQLRQLEVDLGNWEDSLPEWLQLGQRLPLKPIISGSSNLQLCFLEVKLLIRRIKLHGATKSDLKEQILCYRSESREGALEIVDFILALEKSHMQEFWLPYNAYQLSSTAMFLLRCAIETEDKQIKDTCLSSLKNLIDYLEKAKEESDWDIGNVCLAHCKTAISRMLASQSMIRENAGLTTEFRGFSEFISGDLEDLNVISGVEYGMVEGFEFDMGDVWDDFCSTLEYT